MKNKSLKILKKATKILLWIIVALLLLVGGMAVYLYANQDEIKQKIVKEFNKSLQTEISVDHIDLSIFQNFPYASVSFNGLKAKSTNKKDPDLLLEAKKVAFSLDVFDLFNKNYTVKRILLDKAQIHIKYFVDGTNNFEFWKTGINDTSEVNFFLKKVKIKNSVLYYEDVLSEQYYTYEIHSLTASGDFVGDISDIKGSADILVQSHKSHQLVVLRNKNVKIATRFTVDSKNHVFTFKNGDLKLEDMSFNVLGNIDYTENKEKIYLFVTGDKLLLHQFFSVLPDDLQKVTSTYNSKGVIDFKAIVKGSIAGQDIPEIKANFRLSNGELYHDNSKISCKNVRLKGSFTNGEKHLPETYNLNISDFYVQLYDDTLSGNFAVRNFLLPKVSLNVAATANLENLAKFFVLKNVDELKGKGRIKFAFEHTFNKKEIVASDFLKDNISGKLSFQNVSLKSPKIPYSIKISSIDAIISSTAVEAVQFEGSLDNTQLSFGGELKNLLPYLLFDKEVLVVNGRLESNNLDINEWTKKSKDAAHSPATLNNKSVADNTEKALPAIPDNIQLNLSTKINTLKKDELLVKNIAANITYQAPVLNISGLTAEAFNGTINADINAVLNAGEVGVKMNLITDKIEFSKFLHDFDNFSQINLTDKNVKGRLSAVSQIQFNYDFEKGLAAKSLVLHSDVKIENGELINAPMMQKLSKFVDEESLKNVKFSTLQNTIDISNETIYVPEMKIAMNDINFTISGVHKFNNDIDYRLSIKLSEVLSQRRKMRHKDKTNEFGIEEEEEGRVTLFIIIYGNLDNPKFKYDKRSATKKFNENLQVEKQNIKSVLGKEFEWTKKSDEKIEQERLWKEQEKGKFVIDWEEEKSIKSETKTKPEETSKKKEKFKIEFEDE